MYIRMTGELFKGESKVSWAPSGDGFQYSSSSTVEGSCDVSSMYIYFNYTYIRHSYYGASRITFTVSGCQAFVFSGNSPEAEHANMYPWHYECNEWLTSVSSCWLTTLYGRYVCFYYHQIMLYMPINYGMI